MSVIDCDMFCKIMDRIEQVSKFVDLVDNLAVDYGLPDVSGLAFFDAKEESYLLQVLGTMFDCDDLIEWWVYETNFGHDEDCWVEENGEVTYLRTAKDLYDCITK